MFSNERTTVATRQLRVTGDVAGRAVPAPGGSAARQLALEEAGALLAGKAHGLGAVP